MILKVSAKRISTCFSAAEVEETVMHSLWETFLIIALSVKVQYSVLQFSPAACSLVHWCIFKCYEGMKDN